MAKYRKKPIVIEAIQFDGSAQMAIELNHKHDDELIVDPDTSAFLGGIVIHTLEGSMVASKGDWIITGVQGERYPCKPEIFAETYEKVKG